MKASTISHVFKISYIGNLFFSSNFSVQCLSHIEDELMELNEQELTLAISLLENRRNIELMDDSLLTTLVEGVCVCVCVCV